MNFHNYQKAMTDSDFPQLEIKNTDTEKVTELFMWENDKWICELAIALRENCWYNIPHSGGNELYLPLSNMLGIGVG